MANIKIEEEYVAELMFTCSKCGTGFLAGLSLQRHIKKHHTTFDDIKPFKGGSVNGVICIDLDDNGDPVVKKAKMEQVVSVHEQRVKAEIVNEQVQVSSPQTEFVLIDSEEEEEEVESDIVPIDVRDKSLLDIDPMLQSFSKYKKSKYPPLDVAKVQEKQTDSTENEITLYAPSLPVEKNVKKVKKKLNLPLMTSTPLRSKPHNSPLYSDIQDIYFEALPGYGRKCFLEEWDQLCIVRTGGGKSLCFQLPVVLKPDNVVLVIAPITAFNQGASHEVKKYGS